MAIGMASQTELRVAEEAQQQALFVDAFCGMALKRPRAAVIVDQRGALELPILHLGAIAPPTRHL